MQEERDQFYQDLMELQKRLEEENLVTQERFREEAAHAEARHLLQSQRIIRKMLNQHLALAFHTFLDRIADVRRIRAVLKRVLLRMMKRSLSAGFHRFTESCESQRCHRKALKRILTQWTKRSMLECFHIWLDAVASRADEMHREAMRKVQSVMAKEGHYEHKYNSLKARFQQHGIWLIGKLSGMKLAHAFDLFHDKVCTRFARAAVVSTQLRRACRQFYQHDLPLNAGTGHGK